MATIFLALMLRTTALTATVVLLLAALRIRRAAARHAALAAVVATMLVAPLWTLWGPKLGVARFSPAADAAPAMPVTPIAAAEAAWTARTRGGTAGQSSPPPIPRRPWAPAAVAALYLAGVAWFGARLLGGSLRALRLARTRNGARVTTPVTVGWFRPRILLPAAARDWTEDQLACVWAHEQAHARRRDPLVQWLAQLNRALYWFHPLAWWLERTLAHLAEEACDEAVIDAGHDPRSYCELLVHLARGVAASGGRLAAALPLPGGRLERRIRRVLEAVPAPASTFRMAVFALVAIPAAILALAAVQATVPPPQAEANLDAASLPHFEVATIKPTDPHVRYVGMRKISPGGYVLYSAYTLSQLLHDALGVEDFQVSGGPKWATTQEWDIEAKPPEGSQAAAFRPLDPKVTPPPDELLMLRALLIERFHLQLVAERQTGTVYTLSPTKNGVHRDQFTTPAHPDERPLVTMDRLDEDDSRPGVNYAYVGHNATTALLAQRLSERFHAPVTDSSGLAGNFDFIVRYSQDNSAPTARYGDIVQALQNQLGLRLTAGKGPVETYVIEHAEMPRGN